MNSSHYNDFEHMITTFRLSADTTDVQLAEVQFDNNQTVAVTCHFAEGSQALGCHVQLNFSKDFQTWNIFREDESLTSCVVLEVNITCYPSDCNLSQAYVYDWEANGTVGTLPIPVETVFSEEALKACSTAPDTPTSGNIKPAGIY